MKSNKAFLAKIKSITIGGKAQSPGTIHIDGKPYKCLGHIKVKISVAESEKKPREEVAFAA